MSNKYIDFTKEIKEFKESMLGSAKKLNGQMRNEIKSFVYMPDKTEWSFEVAKNLLDVLTSTLGHSRQEISEFAGEDLPVSRLSEFANTDEKIGLINLETATAFVDVVDMLIDEYADLHKLDLGGSKEQEQHEQHEHEHHEHH